MTSMETTFDDHFGDWTGPDSWTLKNEESNRSVVGVETGTSTYDVRQVLQLSISRKRRYLISGGKVVLQLLRIGVLDRERNRGRSRDLLRTVTQMYQWTVTF